MKVSNHLFATFLGCLLLIPATEAGRRRKRKKRTSSDDMIQEEKRINTKVTREIAAAEQIVEKENALAAELNELELEREKKLNEFLETEVKHYDEVVSFCNTYEDGEEEATKKCIDDIVQQHLSIEKKFNQQLTIKDTESEIMVIQEEMNLVATEAETEIVRLERGADKVDEISTEFNELDPTYFEHDIQALEEEVATLQKVANPTEILTSDQQLDICLEFTNVFKLFNPDPLLEALFFALLELGIELAYGIALGNGMDVENLAMKDQYVMGTHGRILVRSASKGVAARRLRMKVSSSYSCACGTDALQSDVVRRRDLSVKNEHNYYSSVFKELGLNSMEQDLGLLDGNDDEVPKMSSGRDLSGILSILTLPDNIIELISKTIHNVFENLSSAAIIPCLDYDAAV